MNLVTSLIGGVIDMRGGEQVLLMKETAENEVGDEEIDPLKGEDGGDEIDGDGIEG